MFFRRRVSAGDVLPSGEWGQLFVNFRQKVHVIITRDSPVQICTIILETEQEARILSTDIEVYLIYKDAFTATSLLGKSWIPILCVIGCLIELDWNWTHELFLFRK